MMSARFRTKMLLVTVLPVVATAIILAFVLISGRVDEFNKRIDDKGNDITKYLSIISEYGLFSNNFEYLKSTLLHTINQEDVVAIYLEDNKRSIVLKEFNNSYKNFNLNNFDKTRFKVFTSDILKTSIEIDDIQTVYEEQSIANNTIGTVNIIMDLRNIRLLKTKIIRNGIFITLSLTLLTIFIAILFSRSVTGPIRQIHADVNIIKQGNLKHRIPVNFSGELAELASGINNMTASLEDAQNEEKRQHELLATAKKEAEYANRAKSLFLSSMSHEMRTPLNAILGFSQLIELDAEDDDIKNNTQEIIRSSRHLLELIEGLLDISQIESGSLVLSIESYSIKDTLEFCLSMVKPLAEEKSVQIDNQVDKRPDIKVEVDNKLFKQVLLNVLTNAIKYNIQNGSVIIDYSIENEKTLSLSVTDTGKGIELQNHDKLFNYFDRAGQECSNIAGSGLGLAISKSLIEKMKGRIEFESTVGEGSCFFIKVPIS